MHDAIIKPKNLREKCQAKGIRSLSALARQLGCSRQAIYFALERPARYGSVYRRIIEVIQ